MFNLLVDEEEIPGTLTAADWSDLQKLAELKVFKRNTPIIQVIHVCRAYLPQILIFRRREILQINYTTLLRVVAERFKSDQKMTQNSLLDSFAPKKRSEKSDSLQITKVSLGYDYTQ